MSTLRKTVDGLRGEGRGWTLLVVAAGWLFLSGFRVVLPALLPQIKADFAVDNANTGFALTVLWLLYASLQFPAGITADRIGERRLLIGGAALSALSFTAFYAAPVFVFFLLACALFGIAAGLFGTPRDMLLSQTYPEADSTAYAVTFAAGSLGAATLPYVGTAVANRWGWRVGVAWLLPLVLVVAVGLWRVVPAARPAGGTDRLAAGETVRRTLGALTDRSVLLASAVFLPFIFTYQAMVAFLPTYLVEIKRLDQGLAALLFGLLFVVGVVTQPVAGHAADQYGERRVILLVILLATVTLGVLPVFEGTLALAVLVPLLGVRIAIGPLVSAFIVRVLPQSIQGTGWGFLRTVFFGVGATGSTMLGLFADAGLFDLGFLVLAGLTGLTAVCWAFTPRPGSA
jgi:predicted MFS family arabinose efflux permease